MDARSFDHWTTALTRPSSRRAALRLLVGSLLGGFLAQRMTTSTRAQRPDSDGDGLFDDDETNVYGTNPGVYDSDGDGVGDGEEVYLGTDPLTPAGVGCAAGLIDCFGVCVDATVDPVNCGACSNACVANATCIGGWCQSLAPSSVGDVLGCELGLTECDHTCVDLLTNPYHCGACGNRCPIESPCQGGFCTVQPMCPAGQTRCGDSFCINLSADTNNCGSCGRACADGLVCCGGRCVDISSDGNNCGRCGKPCLAAAFTASGECVNYQCV
jgi:hypothetical protein